MPLNYTDSHSCMHSALNLWADLKTGHVFYVIDTPPLPPVASVLDD